MNKSPTLARITMVSALCLGNTVAIGQTQLYFTDWTADPDGIARMNTDGTAVQNVVTGLAAPMAVEVDADAGKVYWSQISDGPGLYRADLDATNVEQLVSDVFLQYFALDRPNQMIYWIVGTQLWRRQTNVAGNAFVANLNTPAGVAGMEIDSAAGLLYFAAHGVNEIRRVSLDGTGETTLVSRANDLPLCIALDLVNGKFYWTDITTPDGRISRANLDGSNIQDLVTGLSSPTAIAVDPALGKVFWSEAQGGPDPVTEVNRANLDGTNIENLSPFTLVTDLYLDSTADLGACCQNDGTCTRVLETACPSEFWVSGALCTPNPCPTPPTVQAVGSRYIRVTPDTGDPDTAVALYVTSPAHPCLGKYVTMQSGIGRLSDVAEFRLPNEWGAVSVADEEIVPSTDYTVEIESAFGISDSGMAATWQWADVNNAGGANFVDIQLVVFAFQGNFDSAAMEAVDLWTCRPDGVANFADIAEAVLAFQGQTYPDRGCPDPCP